MRLRGFIITALVGCAAAPEQETEVAQASGRDATHSMRGCTAGQPAAIDRRGRLYGMNNGELFVLGD